MPANNCKNCKNRGTTQYTNGMVDCVVHNRRESLGYVCWAFDKRPRDADLNLISSAELGVMRHSNLPLASQQ